MKIHVDILNEKDDPNDPINCRVGIQIFADDGSRRAYVEDCSEIDAAKSSYVDKKIGGACIALERAIKRLLENATAHN